MSTRIRIELNAEAMGRLIEAAVAERRPADWQAEVLVLRALGLPPEPLSSPLGPEPAPVPDDPLVEEDPRAIA